MGGIIKFFFHSGRQKANENSTLKVKWFFIASKSRKHIFTPISKEN